jgi:hypothetical protein
MFYATEAKPQGWLALAVFADGSEALLYLGRSMPHVRGDYTTAFAEVLTDEERRCVRGIVLRCWEGAPDRGRWVAKGQLPIPPEGQRTAALRRSGDDPYLRKQPA